MSATIRVVGYGVRVVKHLTFEAIEHIQAASKVLYFPTIMSEMQWLLERLQVGQHEDLSPLYFDGGRDVENYERVVTKVVSDARLYGDVAFLLPGHPRIGVTPLSWLEGNHQYSDIEVKVSEGVSSFDTMINDLKRDPLEHG